MANAHSLQFSVASLGALPAAADFIEAHRNGRAVIALRAPMGAGKTTLIRALCQRWGALDTVTSPTFAILNIYATKSGISIQHMDLYRLNSQEDALSIGLHEALQTPESITVIEWPDLVEDWLPANTMWITIEVRPDESRRITIDG